jgi:hypothetical protein
MEHTVKVSACDPENRQYSNTEDPTGRLTRHKQNHNCLTKFRESIPHPNRMKYTGLFVDCPEVSICDVT